MKNPLATIVSLEKKRKKTYKITIITINLCVREDESLRDNKFDSPLGVKSKALRPTQEFFEVIQLDDDLISLFCIGVNLPFVMKRRLIEFLKANVDLIAVSPNEILNIDPSVAFHQLNIDHFTYYVAQLRRRQFPEKVEAAMSKVQRLLDVNFIF